MTSELKPCPFCGANAKVKNFGGGRYAAFCENIHKGTTETTKKEAAASWNTRPTPSADTLAGLVRWKHCEYPNQHKMMEHRDGEYVLHSEAAEIIASKDAEIEKLKDGGHESFKSAIGWQERAKAAEADNHQLKVDASKHAHDAETVRRERDALIAELAQIKAQVPIAYFDGKEKFNSHGADLLIITQDKGGYTHGLYAEPVSDSLKADAARYQYLRSRDLETIRNGGVFAGVTPENYILNGDDLDHQIDLAIIADRNDG